VYHRGRAQRRNKHLPRELGADNLRGAGRPDSRLAAGKKKAIPGHAYPAKLPFAARRNEASGSRSGRATFEGRKTLHGKRGFDQPLQNGRHPVPPTRREKEKHHHGVWPSSLLLFGRALSDSVPYGLGPGAKQIGHDPKAFARLFGVVVAVDTDSISIALQIPNAAFGPTSCNTRMPSCAGAGQRRSLRGLPVPTTPSSGGGVYRSPCSATPTPNQSC